MFKNGRIDFYVHILNLELTHFRSNLNSHQIHLVLMLLKNEQAG